ncbi:hypothetical protein SS50377_22527 [Spironucleus salmonicida]|uniref:Uncharacterized protein n=1 Tax=Spironucleus salmonicida TaxID=348837 RepID=V6LCK1_9EUKA|nr:hypothetical protein SS50377_22527 [Spironucleus salmonicida]|eukprot:EST41983.1 Hypothetical protein SS50377_18288 [Spironucleus salmonicida]
MLIPILLSKFGPQNPELVHIEYRIVQRDFAPKFHDKLLPNGPDFVTSALIHSYLETFLFEWDALGVHFYEVILHGTFDQNSTEIQIAGDWQRLMNCQYTFVTHSVTENANQRELANALLSVGYRTGHLYPFGTETLLETVQKATFCEQGVESQKCQIGRVVADIYRLIVENLMVRGSGVSEDEDEE